MADAPIFSGDFDIGLNLVIQHWVESNVEKILEIYLQKGGWEGWAQVELASMLNSWLKSEYNVNVMREQCVYPLPPNAKPRAKRARADIVIETTTNFSHTQSGFIAGPCKQYIIIELKCESVGNSKAFQDNVKDDVGKVRSEILNIYSPALVWSVALSVSESAFQEMMTSRIDTMNYCQIYPQDINPRLIVDDKDFGGAHPRLVLWFLEKRAYRDNSNVVRNTQSRKSKKTLTDGSVRQEQFSTTWDEPFGFYGEVPLSSIAGRFDSLPQHFEDGDVVTGDDFVELQSPAATAISTPGPKPSRFATLTYGAPDLSNSPPTLWKYGDP